MGENSNIDSFKIPLLPTRPCAPFKKPAAPTPNESTVSDNDSTVEPIIETDISNSEQKACKTEKKSGNSLVRVPLPYEEPEWSGQPPSNYNLEIIKNGTIVTNFPIKSSLMVFGRLDVCDLVFEHPSVSRYHAVIQFCKGDDIHPKGFYLYDLNSTHGTFLNKERIKPNIYYKLKVGYILKFGGSSRLHIFQGPEEDEEETQKLESTSVAVEEGCTWGMAEEAVEDEDLADNPFALSTPNEEVYIEDPKKTLRGWFEREGYELEYNVEEKGFQTFSCTIRLPVDTMSGEYLPVEASVSGKKKEAVVACALEACRTLDRMGLLRQSHQESRQPKRKKWEENDYYDSDEDTFYDRTGEIEKRREMRKRLTKKVEVDNFESLSVKLEKLNAEMDEIKSKISSSSNCTQNTESNESDPLDMYMSNLSDASSSISDKFEKRKLKLRLIELEKAKMRLEKLTDIARPATSYNAIKHSGFIGKKLKSKFTLPNVKEAINKKTISSDAIVESDSDDEADLSKDDRDKNETITSSKYGLILDPSTVAEDARSEQQKIELMDIDLEGNKTKCENASSITKQADTKIHISNKTTETNNDDVNVKINSDPSKIVSNNNKSVKKLTKRKNNSTHSEVDVYKTNSEYCTWLPPSNQSGDGITSLNDKYGY